MHAYIFALLPYNFVMLLIKFDSSWHHANRLVYNEWENTGGIVNENHDRGR